MIEPVVTLGSLVFGGQAISTLDDGRKVFVWGGLPGELVQIRIYKKRKNYSEAVVSKVLQPSPIRRDPRDEAYLSTSPWQIIDYSEENIQKAALLKDAMQVEKITVPDDFRWHSSPQQWYYRNKMEYSFWGDDDGLHLALYRRGTHGKQIVQGSSLARLEIDEVAQKICSILDANKVRASQLKTVIVRCNQKGDVSAALFTKDKTFPKILEFKEVCNGVVVYYSEPKSPASVCTSELYRYGNTVLREQLLDHSIEYDVTSFFQVNVPVFEQTLSRIREITLSDKNIIDMYAGVGTIGVPIGAEVLIEIDTENIKMARRNAKKAKVIQASSEQALEHITADTTLIVDPPRSGLHTKLIDQIIEVRPQKIVYLSCNPSTQARDIALLSQSYTIKQLEGYNYFPKTPHIESLVFLERL